jgi:oxygen-dependent protoporphyrinogen oxidase
LDSLSRGKRIAVLGGGITGLAAAHRIAELAPGIQCKLFERANRVGGVLQTVRRDGFLVEKSADNFITNVPWATELAGRLEMAGDLLPTSETSRRALVVKDGALYPIPEGFMVLAPKRIWPILTTPLLSPLGKARMMMEAIVPSRTSDADESLASFSRRRFGNEAYERLIQPLVGGIYTADPEKLSMRAALETYARMETEHGSLIAATLATRNQNKDVSQGSGARYGLFMAPREGMSSLTDALAAKLPTNTIHRNTSASAVRREPNGKWRVTLAEVGQGIREEIFDAVIVALPAPAAAQLLRAADDGLASELEKIPYAGTSIVVLGFPQQQIERLPDCFGLVVPLREQRTILAASISSQKYPGRAPRGQVLIRAFLGGACQPQYNELTDQQLITTARKELRDLIGAFGEPSLTEVVRWPSAMPQYHVGHVELVNGIRGRLAKLRGLFLAGNAYQGVGVPQCIRSGEDSARAAIELVRSK